MANLVGVKWCLIVLLTCIPQCLMVLDIYSRCFWPLCCIVSQEWGLKTSSGSTLLLAGRGHNGQAPFGVISELWKASEIYNEPSSCYSAWAFSWLSHTSLQQMKWKHRDNSPRERLYCAFFFFFFLTCIILDSVLSSCPVQNKWPWAYKHLLFHLL